MLFLIVFNQMGSAICDPAHVHVQVSIVCLAGLCLYVKLCQHTHEKLEHSGLKLQFSW